MRYITFDWGEGWDDLIYRADLESLSGIFHPVQLESAGKFRNHQIFRKFLGEQFLGIFLLKVPARKARKKLDKARKNLKLFEKTSIKSQKNLQKAPK